MVAQLVWVTMLYCSSPPTLVKSVSGKPATVRYRNKDYESDEMLTTSWSIYTKKTDKRIIGKVPRHLHVACNVFTTLYQRVNHAICNVLLHVAMSSLPRHLTCVALSAEIGAQPKTINLSLSRCTKPKPRSLKPKPRSKC